MIGIITFHRAINYGAVLQAYALSKYINDIGGNVEIIDYKSNFISKFYNPLYPINKKLIKNLILYPFVMNKHRKFNTFIQNKIPLSKPVYSTEELMALSKKYNKIITGSDQVWNNKWTGFDKNYFLDFCEKSKKYSYAASFGFSSIPRELQQEYYNLLSDFNYITVRELDGKKIISDLLGKNVDIMPDPVCLLKKEDWNKLIYREKNSKNKKPYLLLYTLENSEKIFDLAKKIANDKNLEIRYICDSLKHKQKFKYESFISPQEFVSLFFNAEYIITNSFHGSMFSLIFNKKFFIKLQNSKGAPNSRLVHLIDTYKLQEIVLDENQDFSNDYDDRINSVDLKKINAILKLEQEKASKYLKELLDKNKENKEENKYFE